MKMTISKLMIFLMIPVLLGIPTHGYSTYVDKNKGEEGQKKKTSTRKTMEKKQFTNQENLMRLFIVFLKSTQIPLPVREDKKDDNAKRSGTSEEPARTSKTPIEKETNFVHEHGEYHHDTNGGSGPGNVVQDEQELKALMSEEMSTEPHKAATDDSKDKPVSLPRGRDVKSIEEVAPSAVADGDMPSALPVSPEELAKTFEKSPASPVADKKVEEKKAGSLRTNKTPFQEAADELDAEDKARVETKVGASEADEESVEDARERIKKYRKETSLDGRLEKFEADLMALDQAIAQGEAKNNRDAVGRAANDKKALIDEFSKFAKENTKETTGFVVSEGTFETFKKKMDRIIEHHSKAKGKLSDEQVAHLITVLNSFKKISEASKSCTLTIDDNKTKIEKAAKESEEKKIADAEENKKAELEKRKKDETEELTKLTKAGEKEEKTLRRDGVIESKIWYDISKKLPSLFEEDEPVKLTSENMGVLDQYFTRWTEEGVENYMKSIVQDIDARNPNFAPVLELTAGQLVDLDDRIDLLERKFDSKEKALEKSKGLSSASASLHKFKEEELDKLNLRIETAYKIKDELIKHFKGVQKAEVNRKKAQEDYAKVQMQQMQASLGSSDEMFDRMVAEMMGVNLDEPKRPDNQLRFSIGSNPSGGFDAGVGYQGQNSGFDFGGGYARKPDFNGFPGMPGMGQQTPFMDPRGFIQNGYGSNAGGRAPYPGGYLGL